MGVIEKARILVPQGELQPPEFVGGLFPKGHISLIASKPGVGKTWFMLSKVHGIALDGVPCLILNGESGFDVLLQRVYATGWTYPPDKVVVLNLVDCLDVGGLAIDEQQGWTNLMQFCASFRPGVVWIDSLVAFVNGDESDMKSIRGVFSRLRAFAEKMNVAVVINHHLRKKVGSSNAGVGDVGLDDVIGSSVISRIACTVFLMLPQGDGQVRVECIKSWYEKTPAFHMEIKSTEEGGVTLKSSMGIATSSVKETLLTALGGNSSWRTAKYLGALLRYSPRTIRHYLQVLTEEGLCERRYTSDQHNEYEYRIINKEGD